MRKAIRIILLTVWAAVFAGAFFISPQLSKIFTEHIYWWILISWVGVIWLFKFESRVSMLTGFVIFCLSALAATFNYYVFSEIIMRVGFVGWSVGLVQTLSEVKTSQKHQAD